MNLDNSSNTNYSLWKNTKKLKRLLTQIPPIQKPDGNWTTTIKDQDETMAEYLSETFTNEPHIPPNNSNSEILKYKAIEKKEIFTIIKKLKNNKTLGYDLITAKMLQKR